MRTDVTRRMVEHLDVVATAEASVPVGKDCVAPGRATARPGPVDTVS
jgi:hypothetical protein